MGCHYTTEVTVTKVNSVSVTNKKTWDLT